MRATTLAALFALAGLFTAESGDAAANARLKLREELLTKLVRAMGAKGETTALSWSVTQPSIRVRPNGISLEGTLVTLRKLRRAAPQGGGFGAPVSREIGAFLPIRTPFSLPVTLQIVERQVRLSVGGAPVVIRDGATVGQVNLAPYFGVRASIGLPKLKVQGSTHTPTLGELGVQRHSGYVTIGARVDI